MKKKFDSVFQVVLLIFLCVVIFTVITYCFFYVKLGAEYYDGQAVNVATIYSEQSSEIVRDKFSKAFLDVTELAFDVSNTKNDNAMEELGKSSIENLNLLALQCISGADKKFEFGDMVGYTGSAKLTEYIDGRKLGNSGIYVDEVTATKLIAVYSPVYGNSSVDGIIAYYNLSDILGEDLLLHEEAEYCFLTQKDGKIIESLRRGEEEPLKLSNIFNAISSLTESKTETDEVKKLVGKQGEGTATLHISGDEYIFVCYPLESLGDEYIVAQMFLKDAMLENERVISNGIFAIAVFVIFLAIIVLIACFIIIYLNKKKVFAEAETDPVTGTSTYKKFAYEAKTILDQNRIARYALINFEIYKFDYLTETLNQSQIDDLFKYIGKICLQMTDSNEAVGHVMNDSFVILMHYTEVPDLSERMKLLSAIVSNYGITQKLGVDIHLSIGIYLCKGEGGQEIQKMFDCAKMALQTNKTHYETPYTIFDSSIASQYLHEAELEVKMSAALKNKDFKLFFQPKYSIEQDRVDSAEVLVRWYNPETQSYIAPDKFIRLFEANGFVSELDHYVFEETCRFLNDLVSHGDKVVPLSVNVSRATAIKPGFLNFYIEKKKEYGIQNDFITLEFTETFASESGDLLNSLLPVLKNSGFKCAIDDFGMGNSSLIAVKELPVDELKFDRALIKKTKDPEKDDMVLKLLIDVSKEIGMQVTQEGVETKEDMDRMKALGCDVIQGYYYSRPMQLVDFIDFLKEDTSLGAIKRFEKKQGV